MKTIILLLAAFLATSAFAKQEAKDVSASEIAAYQRGMEKGCKNAGRQRGDAPAKYEPFCSCIVQRLKAELTLAEWQQAVTYALNGQRQEEQQLMGGHLKNLYACKKNEG